MKNRVLKRSLALVALLFCVVVVQAQYAAHIHFDEHPQHQCEVCTGGLNLAASFNTTNSLFYVASFTQSVSEVTSSAEYSRPSTDFQARAPPLSLL